MNANELVELIEHLENAKYVGASKAATMLRQQQEKLTKYELRHAEQRKRIEELEAEIEALKQSKSNNNNKVNTEPVAWINQNIDIENGKPQLAWQKDNFAEICKPLYTHPTKTLTDEEIQDLWAEMDWSGQPELDFARAILRKAQEK